VVDDQVGSPTWTKEIVRQTKVVLQGELSGLFHCTSEGEVSRYGFACEIFDRLAWDVDVKPCGTDEYPRPAKRPKRSTLENQRLEETGINVMRDYRPALDDYLKKNKEILIGAV
jgi:dTDP-4-dehydrorhamnose reductase